MATELEDLRILQKAEGIADAIWKEIVQWDEFARDVVGNQLARAADSIGANIAESYGRFDYGEKVQFLYYAHGSLFETKYWLNRARIRQLLGKEEGEGYALGLLEAARQLNDFARRLKSQRKENKAQSNTIGELGTEYRVERLQDHSTLLFTETDLNFLKS